MTIQPSLTILIGSFARGTAEHFSDIDIVRVGHHHALSKSVLRQFGNPRSPVSYIDYDGTTFESLYKSGSLFIHHVLTEGKLIEGNLAYWSDLRKRFLVLEDFSNEIQEQLSLCVWLSRPEVFANAVLPQLSHTFRALKNAGIFMLAQNRIYIYDKRRALKKAFRFLSKDDIEVLLIANNSYERGLLDASVSVSELSSLLPRLSARIKTGVEELLWHGTERHSLRN